MEERSARKSLAVIEGHARAMLDGTAGTPYEEGLAMMGAAMQGSGPSTDGDHCHALWLLWGSLTDWIELKPDETEKAERAMRQAAAEWLEVAGAERTWRPWFDRWLYEKCGYERPGRVEVARSRMRLRARGRLGRRRRIRRRPGPTR